jgi:hypothetical protein
MRRNEVAVSDFWWEIAVTTIAWTHEGGTWTSRS